MVFRTSISSPGCRQCPFQKRTEGGAHRGNLSRDFSLFVESGTMAIDFLLGGD